jgi:hypothetical protein
LNNWAERFSARSRGAKLKLTRLANFENAVSPKVYRALVAVGDLVFANTITRTVRVTAFRQGI